MHRFLQSGRGAAVSVYTPTVGAPPTVTNVATVSGGGDGNSANNTASDPATVDPLGPTPTNLLATAVSASQVNLTWRPAAGAAGYRIYRSSNGGPFAEVASSPISSYADVALTPGTTYLYEVRAVDGSDTLSDPSDTDLATTVILTDASLVAGQTVIKAIHLEELRLAINAVRAAAGMSPAVFTDAIASGVVIRTVPISDLRAALDSARTMLMFGAIQYTDANVAAGQSVKGELIHELRSGVQ